MQAMGVVRIVNQSRGKSGARGNRDGMTERGGPRILLCMGCGIAETQK